MAKTKIVDVALPRSSLISVGDGGELMDRVFTILDQARANVVRAVNSNMVIAYWFIGREIVQALQGGDVRAGYGRGFSVTNLKYFRLFYQHYTQRAPEIRHEARDELENGTNGINGRAAAILDDLAASLDAREQVTGFSPNLSWTH